MSCFCFFDEYLVQGYLRQLLSSLSCLHEKEIIYRDIRNDDVNFVYDSKFMKKQTLLLDMEVIANIRQSIVFYAGLYMDIYLHDPSVHWDSLIGSDAAKLARFRVSSTIFLDKLDAIMSQRGSGDNAGSEHESSRRMKTELLVQLDGLGGTNDLVFLLAASNLPWELDHAMLRRFEKRVLVDLSTKEAQETMFQQFLPPTVIRENKGVVLYSDLDYARLSNGYSGADIKLVCKEAAMNPLRQVFDILETLQDDPELGKCIQLDSITITDVEKVLSTIKSSGRAFKDKYTQCLKEFESV
ncbi:unnamed protein product [Rotaria sp. Silwood2]|nr:unnamed protein product [Rotaria sp. Silwood2]